jgi:hypothetical protein
MGRVRFKARSSAPIGLASEKGTKIVAHSRYIASGLGHEVVAEGLSSTLFACRRSLKSPDERDEVSDLLRGEHVLPRRHSF